MNFKDFYLLQESTYFFDVGVMVDSLIHQLQQKMAEKKEIKSGDVFTLNIDDTHDIEVKFLKRLSKAARQYVQDGQTISAMYFPETYENAGRVEIYINPSKKSVGYYKGRAFEDFVNKSLPKYIKDLLRHEFTHAIEDVIKDTLKFRHKKPKNPIKRNSFSRYENERIELNANFMQFLKGIIESDKLLQYHLLQNNLKNATKYAISKLQESGYLKDLTPDNQQKMMRRVFDFLQALLDRAAQHANMG